jgi:hypothetical protein
MLRNTTAVLAILLVIGSSGLSTSAHAGGGGYGSGRGGDGFRNNYIGGSLSGLRNRGHAIHAGGSGGEFRGFGSSDIWGHWGAYYGPMVPTI